MPSYSRNDVILVRYPFTDLAGSKVRPAVIVGVSPTSSDLLVTALTSQTSNLRSGEFTLADWSGAGLNVETAVKRSVFTIDERLAIQKLGRLSAPDSSQLDRSLRNWFGLD